MSSVPVPRQLDVSCRDVVLAAGMTVRPGGYSDAAAIVEVPMPMPTSEPSNEVILEMAPLASNIRLARLVASGLGTQGGMTMEEVEDLRIAVDEACSSLLSAGLGSPMRVRFHLAEGELSVELCAEILQPGGLPVTSQEILDAVTGRWDLQADGAVVELSFTARQDQDGRA